MSKNDIKSRKKPQITVKLTVAPCLPTNSWNAALAALLQLTSRSNKNAKITDSLNFATKGLSIVGE